MFGMKTSPDTTLAELTQNQALKAVDGNRLVIQNQIGIADNYCQQVIEVVSHSSGKQADRLHLLRLTELLLQMFSLRNVTHDTLDGEQLSMEVILDELVMVFEPELLSIPVDATHGYGASAGKVTPNKTLHHLAVVWMNDVVDQIRVGVVLVRAVAGG